jgi:hypothetical protein
MGHPNITLRVLSTSPAIGAEPTIMSLMLPPRRALILPNTRVS